MVLNGINDAAKELELATRFEGWVLVGVILHRIFRTLQVIIRQVTEARLEEVVPRTRLHQTLLQILLANLVVGLDDFRDLGKVVH